VALILAGGRGDRLSILSEERAKPAVIFGGKYRIIDFTLSNCVNSGLYRVGLLTQYRPRSLQDHIGIGMPWDLDRKGGGVFFLQPYMGREPGQWYQGTADAVFQNLNFVEEAKAQTVLVLAGDHVYRMRYEEMLEFHKQKGADCTVAVTSVPMGEVSRFGTVVLDDGGRVVSFEEKVSRPKTNLASMGIYVFTKAALVRRLNEDRENPASSHDFGRDILPWMVKQDKVYAYRTAAYWVDVGTIESYFQANMDLIAEAPRLDLYDRDHPFFTKEQNRPPAKTGPLAQATRSLVGEGCVIHGIVRNSILSPGVRVDSGAIVEDSIIFDDTWVAAGARVHRSIVDKEVNVGPQARVGWGDDYTPNREEPHHLASGITIVGKRAQIPAGATIGRNCKICPGVLERQFASSVLPSGDTVRPGA